MILLAISAELITFPLSFENCNINESSLGFLNITDTTAVGLTEQVSDWLHMQGLNLEKMWGQDYYGTSVMSGKKGGVQKLFGDLITTAPVPYIYCSSHNVNLVINDAIEANVTAITFFGTLSQIFNFFLSNLKRWSELAFSSQQEIFCNI